MQDSRMFLVFWLVNSLILYFAPLILVGMIVTGNARLAPFLASIISAFILTTALAVTQPVFTWLKIDLKDEWQWALVYLFVNVLGLWVIARYADLTGVGIANAWVAVILGAVANVAQWLAWKYLGQKKK